MTKEKQISEMTSDLENHACMSEYHAEIASKMLYNAGYRKASDVAREIFEEIEEWLGRLADESKILRDKEINLGEKTQLNGEWIGVRLALRDIAELKKKYTEEGKWKNLLKEHLNLITM